MSYDAEDVQSVRLDTTPSLLFNNLAVAPHAVAVVHKSEVALIDAAGLGSDNLVLTTRKVPFRDSVPILQACWCYVTETPFLVLTLRTGFQVWDSTGTRLVYMYSLKTVVAPEDEASSFTKGAVGNAVTSQILVGCSTGEILVTECRGEDLAVTRRASCHLAPVAALALHETGATVVSADDAGVLVMWDASPMDVRKRIDGDGVPATSLAVRGDMAAMGNVAGKVRLFRISAGVLLAEIDAHARAVTALDFHPCAMKFASVGEDAVLNVWSVPGATVGSFRVESEFSAEVTDHHLTGVQFTRSVPPVAGSSAVSATSSAHAGAGGRHAHLVVSAFDILSLRVFRERAR